MKKDDVKAFFLIFFILLVISGVAIFGIKMYMNIMGQNDIEQLFQGNVLITPDEENEPLVVDMTKTNEILNQIASADNPNQEAESSTITKKNQEYYYKQLDSYAKIIYDEMKNNKENLKTGTYKVNFGKKFNTLLSQENGSDLLQEYYQSAIETYLYDNPDVFYLEPTKMYINIQTTKKVFSTTYEVYIDSGNNLNYLADGYSSKEQVLLAEEKLNQEVQKILEGTNGKSNYQKMLKIHDYLVDNVTYEETISKSNIYNIYGAIVNKEAVCEGYAKAFKYLMDQVGIESIVIIGDATDSQGNTQNHAWNYVNLDNTWYAVDSTWDDPLLIGGGRLTKKLKYKYFLKGSVTMGKDHTESYTFIENGRVYTHPTLSQTDY